MEIIYQIIFQLPRFFTFSNFGDGSSFFTSSNFGDGSSSLLPPILAVEVTFYFHQKSRHVEIFFP
jgi:hypothetical protein